MSRFEEAMEVLGALEIPLFQRMKAEGVPYPMSVDTAKAVTLYVPEGGRNRVRKAIEKLTRSRRYLLACCADGAQRYDLMGNVVGHVTSGQCEWARRRLAIKQDAFERRQEAMNKRHGEAFAALSPEDQREYLRQVGVYGQAGIHVDEAGRARLLTPEALVERQRRP